MSPTYREHIAEAARQSTLIGSHLRAQKEYVMVSQNPEEPPGLVGPPGVDGPRGAEGPPGVQIPMSAEVVHALADLEAKARLPRWGRRGWRLWPKKY